MKPPKVKQMMFLCLNEGPADGIELPIAPTMNDLVYEGQRYYRTTGWRTRPDGTTGGSYLWAGWTLPRRRDMGSLPR